MLGYGARTGLLSRTSTWVRGISVESASFSFFLVSIETADMRSHNAIVLGAWFVHWSNDFAWQIFGNVMISISRFNLCFKKTFPLKKLINKK